MTDSPQPRIESVAEQIRSDFPDHDFASLEDQLRAWQARYERGLATATYEEARGYATQVGTARRLVALHSTALAARNVNLGNGVITLLNARNGVSIPVVARALFESCAVSAYMRRHLVPLLAKPRAMKAKVMLFRLGLGTDPGADWGRLRPYRVSAFVKALAAEADELATEWHDGPTDGEAWGTSLSKLYSALTDQSHPNWSATAGNALVLSPQLEPTWTLTRDVDDDLLAGPVNTAYLALVFGGLAWDGVIAAANRYPLNLPPGEGLSEEDLHGTGA